MKNSETDSRVAGNAAEVISSSPTRPRVNIFAKKGAPVVAVNDGVIRKLGHSAKLGNFVILEDTYGNRYTYADLGKLVRDNRTVVPPGGKEKQVPVDSQELRPRLRALPARAGKGVPKEQKVEAKVDETLEKASGNGSIKVGSKVIAGTVLAHVAEGTAAPTPTSTSGSARRAKARRASTRSRSSTAGSCSKRPRSTGPRARTPSTRS